MQKKYRDVVGLIKVLNIFINSSHCFEKLQNSILLIKHLYLASSFLVSGKKKKSFKHI